MVRPIINSEKRIVQFPINNITAGTHSTLDILVVGANNVEVGTVIKAVFIEIWLLTAGASVGSQILMVEKLQNLGAGGGFASIANLDAYGNKRNIFYQTMGLLGENNSNPIPVIRQWIKIPKGKQRFAQGDSLRIGISSQANDVTICGQAIFKAYN